MQYRLFMFWFSGVFLGGLFMAPYYAARVCGLDGWKAYALYTLLYCSVMGLGIWLSTRFHGRLKREHPEVENWDKRSDGL